MAGTFKSGGIETNMSSKIFALFIWYRDDPVTGNVLNISSVTEPRKEFVEYKEGDAVKARCGAYGVVPAIIGKIGGRGIQGSF